MKLTLIRHAPPCVQGICYGHCDVEVQCISEQVAQFLHHQWTSAGSPRILSSPSMRCTELAKAIVGNASQTIHKDERLRELDFGDWENIPWSEIPRTELDTWGMDWIKQRPPHGESFHELCFRIDDFMSEVLPSEHIWVVSHAGPIRIMLARLRQQDPTLYFDVPVPHLEPLHAP